MEEFLRNKIPLFTEPSLKRKTEEIGIDFDLFIDRLKRQQSDMEIASELGISEKSVNHLREHFERRGLGPYIGHE